jgi:hypothetical protein
MRRVLPAVAVALQLTTPPAVALTLRSPQVVFNAAVLQQVFNERGDAINAYTDQLDAPKLANLSDPATADPNFTLIRGTARAIGLYQPQAGGAPRLIELFPAGASAGAYVASQFTTTGTLRLIRYDSGYQYLGTDTYPGVARADLGFYIQGDSGPMYSEDALNGGAPQVLVYAGDASDLHDWFLCFESRPYSPYPSDEFAAGVVDMSPSGTCYCVPVHTSTWGSVKLRYR